MAARVIASDVALFERLRTFDSAWIDVARAFGFEVVREPGAYVAYAGDSVLRVAPYDELDPDDCLAQIVLHELCHFAVEGEASRAQWDWGLDNTTDVDVPAEHAALRLQAAVLDSLGLRAVLAPTTDFRAYYDALPDDPLEGPSGVAERARAGRGVLLGHPGWHRAQAELAAIAVFARQQASASG